MPCCWRWMLRASATTEASWLFPKNTTGPLSLPATGSVPQERVSLPALPAALISFRAHLEPWKLPAFSHRKQGAKAMQHKEQSQLLLPRQPVLSRAHWRETHPRLTNHGGGWCSLWSVWLLPRFPENWKDPEKNNPIVTGNTFRKTWLVATHTLLWESIGSLTQETASASKYFGFSTFQHTRSKLQNIPSKHISTVKFQRKVFM